MLDRCSAAPSLRTLRFPVVALVLGSALATTLVGEPAGACSPNALPLVLSTGPCGVVLPAGDTIPADTESLIFGLEPQAVNRPTDNFSDLSEQEIQDAISLTVDGTAAEFSLALVSAEYRRYEIVPAIPLAAGSHYEVTSTLCRSGEGAPTSESWKFEAVDADADSAAPTTGLLAIESEDQFEKYDNENHCGSHPAGFTAVFKVTPSPLLRLYQDGAWLQFSVDGVPSGVAYPVKAKYDSERPSLTAYSSENWGGVSCGSHEVTIAAHIPGYGVLPESEPVNVNFECPEEGAGAGCSVASLPSGAPVGASVALLALLVAYARRRATSGARADA